MSHYRFKDVDQVKGFAIFLVVAGHLTLRSRPMGNEWYIVFEGMIYQFHMPLFMFISGFIMYYSFPEIISLKDFFKYLAKKFMRLMIPFFLFSFAIIIGKYAAQNFLFVDNPPESLLSGLSLIFLRPSISSGRSLWFIYVLFEYYVIFSILILLLKDRIYFLLIFGAFLYFFYLEDIFIPSTKLFAFHYLKQYFLAFSLGIVACKNKDLYFKMIYIYRNIFLIAFICSFIVYFLDIRAGISKLIIGLVSIPAIHSIIIKLNIEENGFLGILGKYTFSIYLLNTIVIGTAKGIILRIITWDGINFLFIAPVLLILGIWVPILVNKYVFSRTRLLYFLAY